MTKMHQSIKAFLVILLFFVVDKAICQDTSSIVPANDFVQDTSKTLPEFPGGVNKAVEFLRTNFKVPKKMNDVSGAYRIIAVVKIAKDGSVTKPRVLKSYNDDVKKEMLRVLKLMPKWIPGKINGKPEAMEYFIPFYVHF